MRTVSKGDRVKMTDAMAAVMTKGLAPRPRKTKIDWSKRRGVVLRTGRYGADSVTVKWDGAGADHYPFGAIERVDHEMV